MFGKNDSGGFIDCGLQCKYCQANPGCEKNIVHNDSESKPMHRCRSCKKSWEA